MHSIPYCCFAYCCSCCCFCCYLFLCTVVGEFDSNLRTAGQGSYSSYQSAEHATGDYADSSVNAFGAGSFSSASTYGEVNHDFQANHNGLGGAYGQQIAASNSFDSTDNQVANSFEQQSSSAVTTNYPTDAQGLYQDPNPTVIRRPALENAQSYVQRVIVRFLQPPPVPPPGVRKFAKDCVTVRDDHFTL
jgi:hypothetical protein